MLSKLSKFMPSKLAKFMLSKLSKFMPSKFMPSKFKQLIAEEEVELLASIANEKDEKKRSDSIIKGLSNFDNVQKQNIVRLIKNGDIKDKGNRRAIIAKAISAKNSKIIMNDIPHFFKKYHITDAEDKINVVTRFMEHHLELSKEDVVRLIALCKIPKKHHGILFLLFAVYQKNTSVSEVVPLLKNVNFKYNTFKRDMIEIYMTYHRMRVGEMLLLLDTVKNASNKVYLIEEYMDHHSVSVGEVGSFLHCVASISWPCNVDNIDDINDINAKYIKSNSPTSKDVRGLMAIADNFYRDGLPNIVEEFMKRDYVTFQDALFLFRYYDTKVSYYDEVYFKEYTIIEKYIAHHSINIEEVTSYIEKVTSSVNYVTRLQISDLVEKFIKHNPTISVKDIAPLLSKIEARYGKGDTLTNIVRPFASKNGANIDDVIFLLRYVKTTESQNIIDHFLSNNKGYKSSDVDDKLKVMRKIAEQSALRLDLRALYPDSSTKKQVFNPQNVVNLKKDDYRIHVKNNAITKEFKKMGQFGSNQTPISRLSSPDTTPPSKTPSKEPASPNPFLNQRW